MKSSKRTTQKQE